MNKIQKRGQTLKTLGPYSQRVKPGLKLVLIKVKM